ncbi:MAG: hypothetical protein PHT59_06150, partial [Candidatus Omnitrophica bacterium]|nr:hypothetical protein [Candidatus Omnitrophota bacterium]
IALAISFCFFFEQTGFAQVAPQMPIPQYLQGLISPDTFRPVQLRSLSFDSKSRDFSLFLDPGDQKKLDTKNLTADTRRLFDYFQVGLRLPNSVFWVNLRPDSPHDIINPALEKTDVGKVLLEADLQLKKDVARYTSPETGMGRKYWDKLYARA